MRAAKAPCANVSVRSIALECLRAARSSRASIRSGATPFACRASFIARSRASSDDVGAVACAGAAKAGNAKAVTATVRTRRGTSAEDVSRPCGRKPGQNLCFYTFQTGKFIAKSEKFAVYVAEARLSVVSFRDVAQPG